MELLSSINNSGIGAQYAVSAAKDVNGNEITSTYLTAVPEGYATESFVTSQGYITGSYLTADALDNVSGTWNNTYNTVHDNSASWAGGVDSATVSAIASSYADKCWPLSTTSINSTAMDVHIKWGNDQVFLGKTDTYGAPMINMGRGGYPIYSAGLNFNRVYGGATSNANSRSWSLDATGVRATGNAGLGGEWQYGSAEYNQLIGVYDTVSSNSASWVGGGASVISPRGTINVNGDEIEGTNSAVLTGTAGGYETYLLANNSYIRPDPDVLIGGTTTFPQTGGTLVIPVQNGDPSLYITVTGETNDGVATASGQGSAGGINFVYIPLGEMHCPFTAQASYWTNLSTITLTASAAPTTGITGVGELAWNSALNSVRNLSATWKSTYNTVATNSASWGAGSTYTGDAQGALDEVYSKSGDWNTVTDKLNTTAFSTVSGDFLTAHQTLQNSANWDSTYTTVNTNSASWATVTDKLDSTAFSTVSSNFLTAHQALPNSGNWDETYTTVSTNSADWNSAAAMNELPVSAGEGMDIQNVDGTIVFSCTGGSVPEGVLVESGLEYNANNEISGYSGSAFAQPSISAAEWNSNYETVNTNSGAWGGNALPISAGPGVKVELTDGKLLFSTDETVLYTSTVNAKTTAFTLSEPLTAFEKVRFEITGYTHVYAENTHQTPSANTEEITTCFTYYAKSTDGNPLQMMMGTYSSTDGLNYGLVRSKFLYMSNTGTTWSGSTADGPHLQKIIGINRTAGGN